MGAHTAHRPHTDHTQTTHRPHTHNTHTDHTQTTHRPHSTPQTYTHALHTPHTFDLDAISFRIKSPVPTTLIPKSLTSLLQMVPFPPPGGPTRTNREEKRTLCSSDPALLALFSMAGMVAGPKGGGRRKWREESGERREAGREKVERRRREAGS